LELEQIINRIYPLSAAAQAALREKTDRVSYPKGTILLRANRVEKNIYFLKTGIVRAYAYQDDREITFWFGREGDAIISMKSYIEQEKGYEDIELLEDGELYRLRTEDLHQMYKQDVDMANWGRKFAEQELIRTEARLISRQFSTASERYRDLLHTNPDLLQRVPLRHIASYLGITQVSLSRIRSELR
jgi:CRP-like cAMP-binding protein